MEFVRKWNSTPNTFPSLDTGFIGSITTLHHETFNVTMKCYAIVGTAGAKGQKVEGRPWGSVAKYFKLEIANRRVQSYGHIRYRLWPFLAVYERVSLCLFARITAIIVKLL